MNSMRLVREAERGREAHRDGDKDRQTVPVQIDEFHDRPALDAGPIGHDGPEGGGKGERVEVDERDGEREREEVVGVGE